MELDGALTIGADGSQIVRFERFVPRPADKVWAALTDPALLRLWLSDAEIDPRVGGKYVIHWRGMDEVMTGVITVFEPARALEHTWFEKDAPNCRVRWDIEPAPGGCTLTLTHTAPAEVDAIGFLGGWDGFDESIPRALDGEYVEFDGMRWRELDAAYRAKYGRDRGVPGRVASVRFERVLPGPVTRVWDHLTKTALLPGWFGADSSIEPRLGGAVSLMGGHIRGTITQWGPPLRLAYTWNVFNPGDGGDAPSAYPESYLSFTLEDWGETVFLTLTHLPILERFEKQNAMGWHTMLDILGATLRGEKPEERSFYMKKNGAIYDVDLSNLAR